MNIQINGITINRSLILNERSLACNCMQH